MNVSSEQILAAAVGKAIAESVTPELTVQVFTEAFKSFMEKPMATYGDNKTTLAQATLQDALKAVLKARAEAFLAEPEQAAHLDALVGDLFNELISSGKLQDACRATISRTFQHVALR